MRTSRIAAAASMATLASARIVGFAVPSTVAPDSIVKLNIIAENYVQATENIAVSFGISPANTSILGSLGTYLDSKFLGPDFSNEVGNITHYVHIPATTANGAYTFQGALFELTGVRTSPLTSVYYANITVGGNTSPDYVRSALIPQTQ